MDKLDHYLDLVCRGIGGPRSLRQHIRQELREHLLDAAAEHRSAGLSEQEALTRALADFGGPDQVGSELAAMHGHRLTAVMIDKAIEWKERTMKARWLWTTWSLLVVVGVLVMEVWSITFSRIYLVPKLQKFARDGWVMNDDPGTAGFLSWARSFLHSLDAVGRHTTWLLLGMVAAWGLFEWRVRSENKSFMRLAALGTAALVLSVVFALQSATLIIPLELAIPGIITHPPEQIVKEQVTSIDALVDELEQSLARQDWDAVWEKSYRLQRELESLARLGSAAPVLASLQDEAKVEEIRAQLSLAKKCLERARDAIPGKDANHLENELQKFHKLFAPIHDAATKSVGSKASGK